MLNELEAHPGKVERVWIVWHALIGVGAGLLFIPASGPPFHFVVMFLATSLTIILGVQWRKLPLVIGGLIGLSLVQVTRGIVLWGSNDLGSGSRLVASFLWGMLAMGGFMEAYAVKNRGIS